METAAPVVASAAYSLDNLPNDILFALIIKLGEQGPDGLVGLARLCVASKYVWQLERSVCYDRINFRCEGMDYDSYSTKLPIEWLAMRVQRVRALEMPENFFEGNSYDDLQDDHKRLLAMPFKQISFVHETVRTSDTEHWLRDNVTFESICMCADLREDESWEAYNSWEGAHWYGPPYEVADSATWTRLACSVPRLYLELQSPMPAYREPLAERVQVARQRVEWRHQLKELYSIDVHVSMTFLEEPSYGVARDGDIDEPLREGEYYD